ncbi:hypothetical protein Patl1_14924 [Pistacia atlantica]|uniref:Uncharacterized protein n=1 Tax=Pistacia atlantica TaxID=434234 RepID=A0ACC1ASB6_9ROSI|nr:hypothetical protein Patl1_14924 [Pistacia atlantica]
MGDVPDMVQKIRHAQQWGLGRNPGKTRAQMLNLGHNPVEVMRRPRLTNRMLRKIIWPHNLWIGSTPSRGFKDGQKDKSVSSLRG